MQTRLSCFTFPTENDVIRDHCGFRRNCQLQLSRAGGCKNYYTLVIIKVGIVAISCWKRQRGYEEETISVGF